MKTVLDLLLIFALVISWGFLIVLIPRHWMRKYKLKYVLRENESLKRDSRRYALIKKYGTPAKFLELLRESSYEDIDDFVLGRIRNCFRGMMANSEGFISAYLFVGTLEGDMYGLMQQTLLEVFREKGTMHIGGLIFDAITENGQHAKVELEKALVDLEDAEFSRKVYCHVEEYLKTYIEIDLGDIIANEFKSSLESELKRIQVLTI